MINDTFTFCEASEVHENLTEWFYELLSNFFICGNLLIFENIENFFKEVRSKLFKKKFFMSDLY